MSVFIVRKGIVRIGGGGGVVSDWILATGFWIDANFWRDDEFWID